MERRSCRAVPRKAPRNGNQFRLHKENTIFLLRENGVFGFVPASFSFLVEIYATILGWHPVWNNHFQQGKELIECRLKGLIIFYFQYPIWKSR